MGWLPAITPTFFPAAATPLFAPPGPLLGASRFRRRLPPSVLGRGARKSAGGGPAGLSYSPWLAPLEAVQQRQALRKRDGPLLEKARDQLLHGQGAAAAQWLLGVLAAAATKDEPGEDATDAAQALDLIAFACGVSSDQGWFASLLHEVKATRGRPFIAEHEQVDDESLPELQELLLRGLTLEAPEGTIERVLALCQGKGQESGSRRKLGPAIEEVRPALAALNSQRKRLEFGLSVIEEAQQLQGQAVWPGAFALAHMISGCLLAGPDYRSRAASLAEALWSLADRQGFELGEILQPGLLAEVYALLGHPMSGWSRTVTAVQLATAAAMAPGAELTMRHGAALLAADGQVISVGANRNVRLATFERGRSQQQVHAEIDALLRLQSVRDAEGGCMYIAQLDDLGIGFVDAHPCKGGCQSALQIAGLAEAAWTSGRYASLGRAAVAQNADVLAHSLQHLTRWKGFEKWLPPSLPEDFLLPLPCLERPRAALRAADANSLLARTRWPWQSEEEQKQQQQQQQHQGRTP